ncbi:MAG: hisA [Clostridiales bacterium]|jgi:phosphoribosylformimino-5-aminoimidazole carboxamide ribotide isomerase|nr:hisA [Clostridiales bacterium]
MRLYPAIDLKDGKCVRLKQGQFNDLIVYSDNPIEIARKWCDCGAKFLHLVDLDGALKGSSINEIAIRSIVQGLNIPVQVGGGIRNFENIEYMLGLGVNRVILGTKAVQDPEFVREAVERYGSDAIVVGIDAKDGMVATHGWETVSELSALDMCKKMQLMGVKYVVYTDISKDGMLSGPNIEFTQMLVNQTNINIIASGGVSTLEDIKKLSTIGVEGAIIGKALYEDWIDLRVAIQKYDS